MIDDSNTHHGAPKRSGDSLLTSPPNNVSVLRLLIVMLLMVGAAVTLNWPYQFEAVVSSTAGKVDAPLDFNRATSELPVMGGWPFRYSIEYSDTSNGPVEKFSLLALGYNMGLAAIVIACVLWYVYLRERRGRASVKKLSIADLLLLTLLLAAPFAWWKRVESLSQQEHELWKEVHDAGGTYSASAWVPQVFASRFPKPMVALLRRMREVRVEHPPEALVAKIVKQPGLNLVRFGGGDYQLRLLDRLASNPHLVDLRIAGRSIDTQTMQMIGACKRLQRLNLMRTNVSVESLSLLDDLTDLDSLHLVHSDIVLSELNDAKWTKSIRVLRLPHPLPGDEASVSIVGWPNLEDLLILEFESQMNSSIMSVHLEDLPSLTHLGLDIFQKFDLKLRNLPALEHIYHNEHQWQARIPRGGVAPGQIWCGTIDIDNAPALEDLDFFAPGLKYFHVRNAPKFKFAGIGAYFKTLGSSIYAPELKPDVAAAVIEGLGRSEGPLEVDLDAVPLGENVDLSPLAANERIETLKLSYSGTTPRQWKGLESMKWLKRLDVHGCEIDDEGIKWVLDSFPNLEHFSLFPKSEMTANRSTNYFVPEAGSLEIIDRPNLKTIDLGDHSASNFSTVRIVNSPNLSVSLELSYVQTLELIDASAVSGLSVNGPLPPQSKLSGLRDLEFFAVGGPWVKDDAIEALRNCPGLSKITLAYPSVTAEGLRKIPLSASIASLHLPGTPLDDDIVELWPDMVSLDSIDVSDTMVTAKGLKQLLSGQSARVVMLDRANVNSDELGFLADLVHLNRLSVAGVGISKKALSEVLANESLAEVNLSDSNVSTEMLDVLAGEGHSLQYIELRNCTVNEKSLRAIAVKNRNVHFDLAGTEVSTKLMTELLSAKRIVNAEDRAAQLAMQVMMNSVNAGSMPTEWRPSYPAMIDVRRFKELRNRDPSGAAASSQVIVAPSRPIGVQFGRWFGQAIFGGQPPSGTPDPAMDTEQTYEETDESESSDKHTAEPAESNETEGES